MKRFASILFAVTAFFGVMGIAQVASAHTPSYVAKCGSLTADFVSYESPKTNNSIVITIDGVKVVNDTFATSYSYKNNSLTKTQDHTWSIVVDANMEKKVDTEKFDYNVFGTIKACETPVTTTTLPATTTTLPIVTTTTAPPAVTTTAPPVVTTTIPVVTTTSVVVETTAPVTTVSGPTTEAPTTTMEATTTVVAPSPSETPTTPEVTPIPEVVPVVTTTPYLPKTGVNTNVIVLIGACLILVGVVLVMKRSV